MVTKKKPAKTDKAQSERFKALAKELEDAGDLDLTEADKRLNETIGRIVEYSRERKEK